jgi:hypothetical protein
LDEHPRTQDLKVARRLRNKKVRVTALGIVVVDIAKIMRLRT